MSRLPAVLKVLQSTFVTVESLDPADQDVVYRAVLDHVRARRPESCGVLGVLPKPEQPICDPRTAG